MSLAKNSKVIILLLGVMLILGFLWKGLKLEQGKVPSPLISHPAPAFNLPQLFSPNEFTHNDDFIAHVTLLNVWATWCKTCAEEHAFLLKLANTEELRIVGLNYKDDTASAKQWLKDYGNPNYVVAVDASGNTGIDWGVYGTPESFLIDKKGIIRYKHIGPITQDVWDKTLRPLIVQMRNETL